MANYSESPPDAELDLWIDDVDLVSINKMYKPISGGRLTLGSEGRKAKDLIAAKVAEAALEDAKIGMVYSDLMTNGGHCILGVILYTDRLRNKSWIPGKITQTSNGKMRNPYFKRDTPNYMKLLEDAVATGLGIDDCMNLGHWILKKEGSPGFRLVYSVFLDSPKQLSIQL